MSRVPAATDVTARLERSGGVTQLVVHGRSTLLIGGQVHNSTSSHPDSIARAFARAVEIGSNTVFAPVDWSVLEAEEGRFDFDLVDAMLAEAGHRGLMWVPLWFGAFKNAHSTYAPSWVRADTDRFPRAVVNEVARPAFTYAGAMRRPTLSVFSSELREADGRAFEAFMQRLADTDVSGVVPLVQVENEVGLLADSRDRSALAEAAWRGEVPHALLRHLASNGGSHSAAASLWAARGRPEHGSWPEVFGSEWEADEVFMAWAFGSYVEGVAARGSAAHPIPLYVNSWIGPQPGQDRAGEYPSGGPGWRVIDVWQAAAPSIDFIGPDIYLDDSAAAMRRYTASGNPLMVPESRYRVAEAARAFGGHAAIGWSVFGVEDARPGNRVSQLFTELVGMTELVTAAQRESRIACVVLESGEQSADVVLGEYTLTVRNTQDLFAHMLLDMGMEGPPPPPAPPSETEAADALPNPADVRAFVLVLALGDDRFHILGQNASLDFSRNGRIVEWDHVETGSHHTGRWQPTRIVNGDERLRILPLDRVGAARVRVLSLVE
jgi:beta-galactosidase GanA